MIKVFHFTNRIATKFSELNFKVQFAIIVLSFMGIFFMAVDLLKYYLMLYADSNPVLMVHLIFIAILSYDIGREEQQNNAFRKLKI